MIRVCSLFSGSSGNCTYIETDGTGILLDCGVSMKRIVAELERIGRDSQNVKALFITHEHSDHIQSAGPIARSFKIPVYATQGTWRAMQNGIGKIDKDLIRVVDEGTSEIVGDLEITPFKIYHDAAQPVAYTFQNSGKKLTVATDIGKMDDKIFFSLSGSDAILLEANHDIKMLENGSYPYSLKQRIKGKFGHLSNDDAAITCARLAALGTRTFLLGHLSEENNRPDIALKAVQSSVTKHCGDIGASFAVLERGKKGELITV